MKMSVTVRSMAILSMMTALLLIFSFTPIGTIPIGPLSITLNVIPVAIAAVVLGPRGGLIIGSVFGLLSFLQCVGVGVPSAMGVTLFAIDPFLTFIQRVVPRALDGLLLGILFKGLRKITGVVPAGFVTGFCAAFFNTVLFMGSLVLLFGQTEYMQELIGGRNILMFICAFVGINAVVEMIVSTLIVGVICAALSRVGLLVVPQKNTNRNSK